MLALISFLIIAAGCKWHNRPPDPPAAPSGVECGLSDSSYAYRTSASDPDGDSVMLEVSWGDSSPAVWSAALASGSEVVGHKAWPSPGRFGVQARAKDVNGAQSDWSSIREVRIVTTDSLPLPPLTPTGPDATYASFIEDFAFVLQGVPDERLSLAIDWGNGSCPETFYELHTGETLRTRYVYSDTGTYSIRAQAKDRKTRDTSCWSQELRLKVRRRSGEWEQTYSGTVAHSVIATGDGGYVLAGNSGDQSPCDPFLAKTDGMGNLIWQRTYGDDSTYCRGNSVRQSAEGGYIMVGFEDGWECLSGIYLFYASPSGILLWQKRYYEDVQYGPCGYCVRPAPDGGYIVAGGGIIMKTDKYGDSLWTRPISALTVELCPDSGFIFGGWSSQGAILTKTDAQGDELWSRTYSGLDGPVNAIRPLNNGGYVLAGIAYSDNDSAFLAEVDASGAMQWRKTFGGMGWGYTCGSDVCQTSDGGYCLVGDEDWTLGYVVRTDPAGNLLWERTLGGYDYSCARSIVTTSDGACIVAGSDDDRAALFRICQQGKPTGTGQRFEPARNSRSIRPRDLLRERPGSRRNGRPTRDLNRRPGQGCED